MAALFTTTIAIALWLPVAIILLIYLFGSWLSKDTIVTSSPVKAMKLTPAELVYALPAAAIELTASAKVVVTKNTKTGQIIASKLIELSFQPAVTIQPDANTLFALNYVSSGFMNDEVSFAVNADGLLENISTTTEDRLANIIADITEVPAQVLTSKLKAAEFVASDKNAPVDQTTETREFTRDFHILSSEIEQGKSERDWQLNIDGDIGHHAITLNASFAVDFEKGQRNKFEVKQEHKKIDGILTRPLHLVRMIIAANDPAIALELSTGYEIRIPDTSRLINVPIKRSAFVKRINTPKFHSGLLIENYINKPSEFEGLVAIPINIGKALVSIPAQLLTFTVKNKNAAQIADLEVQKQLAQLQKDITDIKAGNIEK
jgi:hypothetical protein